MAFDDIVKKVDQTVQKADLPPQLVTEAHQLLSQGLKVTTTGNSELSHLGFPTVALTDSSSAKGSSSVTSQTSTDGPYTLTYKNGKVTQVNNPDGSVWQQDPAHPNEMILYKDNQQILDSNGKVMEGTFSLNALGGYEVTLQDGGHANYNGNGSSGIYNQDGSFAEYDQNGVKTREQTTDGTVYYFYPNGSLHEFVQSNGAYAIYDQTGKRTEHEDVDKNGSWRVYDGSNKVTSEYDSTDGSTTYYNGDGSGLRCNKDKSLVAFNSKQQVTQITYPDGATASVSYNSDNSVNSIKWSDGRSIVPGSPAWYNNAPYTYNDNGAKGGCDGITVNKDGTITADLVNGMQGVGTTSVSFSTANDGRQS